MNQFKTFFSIALFLISSSFFGEGTKQLRPTEADDGYINLMDTQNGLGTERTFALYDATDETRLNIRVSDPNSEVIYLGFRTFLTDALYYRIKAPDGTIVVAETAVPMTDGDPGRILDYNEAVSGPNTLNAGGYLPIIFDPAITNQTGDYSIEFRDPEHDPGNNYEKRKFELFDITVVNTTTNTPISGRLWSRAWDLTTNSGTNEFSGSTYIYTNDGITTKAEFDGFKPWSFIIQSNSTGPTNTGIVEDDRKSISGGSLLPDYRIFLTEPDPNEFPISELPTIGGLPNLDLCTSSSSYCINIEISNPGIVEYVIDIDGAEGYDNVRDVKLITDVVAGENCLSWNGLDGEGNPLTTTDVFDIILSYQTGITHLFIHDAEDNENGFNVEHVSPGNASTPMLFYDDSDISGNTDLVGCTANCHNWGSDFGNNKTINTWWVTFLENDTIKDLFIDASIVQSEVDIIVSEPVACGGNQMTLEANNINNTGGNPTFTWQVNNIDQGTGNSFVVTNLNEGDSIKLILTPTDICIQPDTSILVVSIPKTPIVSSDITACFGDSVEIVASNISGDFRWLLNDLGFSLDSIDSVYADITRTYTAEVTYDTPSEDLIVNGDFEAGNTGFISDYTFETGNIGNGDYKIVTNPQEGLSVFYDMNDHTSGSGNMLLVDGNTTDGSVVYSTTVNVEAGVVYNFSAWATSAYRTNAPNLQFLVNGDPLSSLLLDLLPRWTQFNTHWTSNVTGTVEIQIVNRNTAGSGNDFALDDIVFGPVAVCTNSVEITVENPLITTADIKSIATICEGDSLLLEVFDTTNIGSSPTYEWHLNGTIQSSADDNIVLENLVNEDSISVITTSSITGCIINKDTSFVEVSVVSKPEISISGSPICKGDTATISTSTTGGTGTLLYTWTPNDSIVDPILATIEAYPQTNTEYQVIVKDANNCLDTAIFELLINDKPEVSISGTAVCEGDSVVMTSTITNQADPVAYSWTPTVGLSSYTSATVKAAPSSAIEYQLIIVDNNSCKDTALFEPSLFSGLEVTIDMTSPICEGDTTTLKTTINTTDPVSYSWTPSLTIADNTLENVQIYPQVNTEYKVVATSLDGCKDSTTYTMNVFDRPVVNITDVGSICEGDTITLNTTSSSTLTSYAWSGIDIIDPILANAEVHPNITTEYTVIVSDNNNCKDTASFTLGVLTNPTVTITSSPICEGDTATLNTTVTNTITSYLWTGIDIIDPLLANAEVHPNTTTEYQVEVTDNNNCKAIDSYELTVNSIPNITIDGSPVCDGQTATLVASATDFAAPLSYNWSPSGSLNISNQSSVEASPTISTTYTVNVQDNNGCLGNATYTVNILNLSSPVLNFTQDTTICSSDVIVIKGQNLSNGTYQWYQNGTAIINETDSLLSVNEAGVYTFSDDNGCPKQFTDTIEVIIDEDAFVNAGLSLVIEETSSASLDGEASGDAIWSIISSESGSEIIEDENSLTSTINTSKGNRGKYTLELCSESPLNKCPIACDTLTILMRGILDAPNTFTPNGDGINETFVIDGIREYPEAQITIYNRWGNIVHDTFDYYENVWNGGDSPSGVYYYIIDLGYEPESDKNYTGALHLLK